MRYLSVCSGIEAATVAWHPLGWQAAAYSEIEKFPSQVLAHHYPNTPNVGDMTKFKEWTNVSDVDVLVGGTPCQSFSVAGLRKGLDDPRGNLMLTYLAIAAKYRPKWLVWENVPGVLSSNGGLDFASLLRGMGELGYGFAYRILDAQYFGVAQRRRRVFVVGYAGNWRPAAAVLFERHSMCGYPALSREKGKKPANCFTSSPSQHCSPNEDATLITTHRMVAFGEYSDDGSASSMKARDYKDATDLVTHPVYELHSQDSRVRELGHAMAQPIAYNIAPGKGALKDDIHVTNADAAKTLDASGSNPAMHQGGAAILQPIAFSSRMSYPHTDVDISQTLQAINPVAVAQPVYSFIQASAQKKSTNSVLEELSNTLTARAENNNFAGGVSMAVRRLTPVECERLQGFPDNYTNIKSKNKPTPDGPRYKALGNSMAVSVMAWIGKRIQEVETLLPQRLESIPTKKNP